MQNLEDLFSTFLALLLKYCSDITLLTLKIIVLVNSVFCWTVRRLYSWFAIICDSARTSTKTNTHTYTQKYTQAHTHLYAHTHAHTHTYTQTNRHTHIYTRPVLRYIITSIHMTPNLIYLMHYFKISAHFIYYLRLNNNVWPSFLAYSNMRSLSSICILPIKMSAWPRCLTLVEKIDYTKNK